MNQLYFINRNPKFTAKAKFLDWQNTGFSGAPSGNIKLWLFALTFFLIAGVSQAQTIITSGNTVNASTIPVGNTVTINAGGTLNMDVVRTFTSITTANTGTSNITGSNKLTVTTFLRIGNASTLNNTLALSADCDAASLETPNLNNRTSTLSGTGILNLSGNININGASNNQTTLSLLNAEVSCANINGGAGNASTTYNLIVSGILKVSGVVEIGTRGVETFTCNVGSTVDYTGASQNVYATTYENLTLSGSGTKTFGTVTVNGVLSRQGTCTTAGTIPVYGGAATLDYRGAAAQITSTEFSTPFAGTGGVQINNANGVTLNAAKTIDPASNLTIGNGVPSSVFNDGGFQLTCTGTLNLISGTFNLGSSGTGTTFPEFGTKNYSTGTTVAFVSDAAQAIAATDYPNLTFSGNGIKTTASGTVVVSEDWSTSGAEAELNTNNSNITVTGDIIGSGNITGGSGTILIAGSWINSGTYIANTGTVEYNGSSPSVAALNYYNLTATPFSGGTSLSGSVNVSNVLTISNSTFNLLGNDLNIGAVGSITITSPATSKMIIASGSGKVRKSFTSNGSFTYPVGENTGTPGYTPVTISVTGSLYSSAFIEVSVTNADHPDNSSATHFLNHYWNITQSGISNAVVDISSTYETADVNGTETSISAAQLNGSFDLATNPWIKFSPFASNTLTATAASLTDGQLSVFTGIAGADPTVAIVGGNVTVCPNVPVAFSTNVTGDALTYLWTPASGLSSSTVADPTATITTTTLYTVTITDGNGFTATDNTTITIDPGPTAGMPGGITGNIITCDGATGIQYSVPAVANAVTYDWTLPVGASIASGAGTRIITVDFPNPFTTGTVCVASENVCVIPSALRCLTVTNVEDYTPNRITGPANLCLNTVGVVYTALSVNGATNYNWTLPTGMNITAGAGTKTITVDVGPVVTPGPMCVSVDNGCGTSLIYCKNININSTTQPGGITGPAGICANNTGIVYSVQPVSGATSYTWSTPADFNIVGGQGTGSITVDIGAAPVAGNVCVTADFACGSSIPRCLSVSINGAIPGYITGPSNFCAGATGVAYSVPDVPTAISYNWTFPSGITQVSGGTTRSITVDVSPSFTQGDICVTVTSPCGTSAPSCKTVYDFTAMMPGGISGPNVVCQNTSGLIYSVPNVAGAVSYNWILPQGFSITAGLNTNTITVSVDNTFTIGDIGVRAVAACGAQSLVRWNTKITTLNPGLPGTISVSADICPSTTVVFSIAAVTGASTYAWTLPSGMTFTAGPPTNTNSVSVDIGAGFTQGDICVNAVTACGVEGNLRCLPLNIVPTVPGVITGPAGVCPGATGVSYAVSPVTGAASYTWELPVGWNITAGSGTSAIVVDVPAGFIQGQIRVYAVSSCGLNGRLRTLNVNYVPATPGVISGPLAICTGNTYNYSVSPVAGASFYTWTLPTGVTFTVGPPSNTNSISVDVNGSFAGGSICVTASTACGNPSTQRCLTVTTTPATPGAISGPAAVCQGATALEYSIIALPGISDYNWIVPAGITIVSGQGTTTLVVNIDGGYTSGQICVEAENACGNPGASACLNVTLTPATPTAITKGVNFCPGSTRTLTVNDVSGAASYTWVLPAGLTLLYGQGTSTILVEVDGAFVSGNVCVTALTTCSAASVQYCENISASNPTTPASIISSSVACAGSSIVFSVPVTAGTGSFTWSLPVGMTIVSGQGTATLRANIDPGYTTGSVCVIGNSACNVSGTQFCKTISTTPETPGNIVAPSSVCANDPEAVFSITPVAGVASYNWVLPAQMTVTSGAGSNAITVAVGPGFTSGQISVAAVSACAVQGTAKTLVVGGTVGAPGIITAPPSVCPNSNGLIFSIAQVTSAASYVWTVPAEFTITSGANTNAITVNVGPGFTTGQVCVSAVSECGVTGAQTCRTINILPAQPGGITGSTKGVCNQTIQYSVSNSVTATSYTWTPPANASITSGQGTNIVQVTFSPAYVSGQLQVYASNACGNSTVRTSAVITGAPDKPTVISGLNAVCANQTAVAYSVPSVFNATSYTWTVPAGAVVATGQGTTSITVDWGTTAGAVSVTAANTCGTSLATNLNVAINCRVISSIDLDPSSSTLSVYPNPVNEKFVVEFDSPENTTTSFELIDLSGRVVLSRMTEVTEGNNIIHFDVNKLPRGVYILHIQSNNRVHNKIRLVLQ